MMITKISCNFNFAAIKKRLDKAISQNTNVIIEAYKKAGIEFVDTARKNKTFGDITHDLVSSMGCILVVNHVEVFDYFPGTSTNGVTTGRSFAREIALLVDDGGIILVCVAGMDYARAVEDRGKDVITGTDLRFAEILRKQLKAIKK